MDRCFRDRQAQGWKQVCFALLLKKKPLPHMQTEVHRDVTHIRDKGRRDHREWEYLNI